MWAKGYCKKIKNEQMMEKYTEREKTIIYNAMQFAIKEVNGRPMRQTFAEIMVDDFIKEMKKLKIND